MKDRIIGIIVYIPMAILLSFVGYMMFINEPSARDLDDLINRPKNHLATKWYPEHRVFCATRLNAVDCVYVPTQFKPGKTERLIRGNPKWENIK